MLDKKSSGFACRVYNIFNNPTSEIVYFHFIKWDWRGQRG